MLSRGGRQYCKNEQLCLKKLLQSLTQEDDAYGAYPMLDVVVCSLMGLQGVRCLRRRIQGSAVVYEKQYTCTY